MKLRRNDVLVVLALLAAFTGIAIVEQQHDAARGVPETTTYAASDVHGGGYAAFAELLARERVHVDLFDRRPGQLDAGTDTLVAAYAPGAVSSDLTSARSDADLDDLRAWIERGGRLVVLGADARVAPRERAHLGRPPLVEATAFGPPFTGPLAAGISELGPHGSARFATPSANDHVALADAGGPLVVDVTIGRGVVRYLNAAQLFDNRNLARHDNARLAYALARPRFPDGLVLFDEGLHGALIDPSIWSIMPVWLRVMLSGLALTVLLALAGSALRLGPPIEPPRAEPTSAAFLDAVTALYERAGTRPEGA
jgi:hypothetical protein